MKTGRSEQGFPKVRTSDGKLLYKSSTENKAKLYYE